MKSKSSQRSFPLLALAVVFLMTAAAAAPENLDQCIACHGSDGMGHGQPMVPVIAGMPDEHIEEAIYAYIDGARQCLREPLMCETVALLSEDEVIAFAEYYGALPRQWTEEEFDPALAAEGEALHDDHCANCHVPPHDEGAARAIGIPLHGQRREYLRYAIESYLSGDREALLANMASRLLALQPGDLGALVHYYASYRAPEQDSN